MVQDYADLAARLGLKVTKDIIGPQSPNISDALISSAEYGFQYITVHDTANPRRGANARMHRRFVKNGGGDDNVSYTFATDSNEAVQILALNQVNYAQGGKPPIGNHVSISIEMCVNEDGDWPTTVDNTAKLVAALRVAGSKKREAVKQHNYWYGKDCPAKLRHTPGGWDAFMAAVDGYVARLSDILAGAEDINGYRVSGGFLDLWKRYGIEVMGLPISPEYKQIEPELGGIEVTYQDWENVITQWYPGIQARIAAGIRRHKYGR
jgi:hypothetical protein